MTTEKLVEMQKAIAELEKELNQARGALKEIRSRLKKEFGCATVKEGKQLLKRLQAEKKALADKLESEIEMASKEV